MDGRVDEFRGLGAVLPGTLEEYYSVCGRKGCACADRKNPRKHGPYYRLSYSIRGRNSCLFVKRADADKIRKMTEAQRRAKDIVSEVSIANLELLLKHGVDGCEERLTAIPVQEKSRSSRAASKESGAVKAGRTLLIWRKRAMTYQKRLEKRRIEARDLRASRDRWRKEALDLRRKTMVLEKRIESDLKDKSAPELKKKGV